MRFRVTFKQDKHVPEVSMVAVASNEEEVLKWAEAQIRLWGWENGTVSGVIQLPEKIEEGEDDDTPP